MKTIQKIPVYWTMALLGMIAIAFIGCASTPPPPTEQLAVANAAIADAVNAGAPELAPLEMKIARDKLERAKLAIAADKNDRAEQLAEQTEVDAKLAEVKARSIKAQKIAAVSKEDTRIFSEELDRKNK